MATIQVRNVPDEVHRTYQARAALAGMSLQEYVLAELVRNAGMRTPAELVAETEEAIRRQGEEGFSAVSASYIVRADRTSR